MNITVDRKVLEMALEALGNLPALSWIPEQERAVFEAITALRTALEQSVHDNGGKTGWPPGLLQDDCRGLSKWFASKPDAKRRVREALSAPTALKQPEQSWTPENLAAMRRLQEKQYQRDAMRQKVQQEPVLWKDKHGKTLMSLDASQPIQELVCRTALEQPKRKPLTDEEIKTYRHMIDWTAEWSYINFARAIEAAHNIKE